MHDPQWNQLANHLAPLIGVQAWIVRELLARRSDVAILQGKSKPSRRKTLLHILILAVARGLASSSSLRAACLFLSPHD
jgi:hypothetical protein